MFTFFINDIFNTFCQNEIGQSFFDLTVKGLKINHLEVDLLHYEINEVPKMFSFDENKNLLIQELQVTEGEVTIEEIITLSTHAPVIYVDKGVKVLSC
jgi:hypothetical protein